VSTKPCDGLDVVGGRVLTDTEADTMLLLAWLVAVATEVEDRMVGEVVMEGEEVVGVAPGASG